MNLFKRFLRQLHFQHYPDHFGMNRAIVFQAIAENTRVVLSRGQAVLLIAHFQDTFIEAEVALTQAEIEFQIVTGQHDPAELSLFLSKQRNAFPPVQVHLALASSLKDGDFSVAFDAAFEVSVILIDVHPDFEVDTGVFQFFRKLGRPVRLARFVSLEDDMVKQTCSEMMRLVLDQYGANSHELFTSQILSRRLTRAQSKNSRQRIHNIACSTSAKWRQANLEEKV